MADQRISGQDTEITIVVDNVPITTIRAVRSHSVTVKMKIVTEEYCGETGPRKDDFYDGIAGSIELDLENSDSFVLIDTIKARAQNRASGTKIAIKAMYQFPDGDRVIGNIPNAVFGDLPINFASRTDYGKLTLSYEAEQMRIVSR